MDESQSYIMTAEGTDLSTDVLSIDGDQPSPERLSGTRSAKHEKNVRALRGLINTMHLYALPSAACIYPPL